MGLTFSARRGLAGSVGSRARGQPSVLDYAEGDWVPRPGLVPVASFPPHTALARAHPSLQLGLASVHPVLMSSMRPLGSTGPGLGVRTPGHRARLPGQCLPWGPARPLGEQGWPPADLLLAGGPPPLPALTEAARGQAGVRGCRRDASESAPGRVGPATLGPGCLPAAPPGGLCVPDHAGKGSRGGKAVPAPRRCCPGCFGRGPETETGSPRPHPVSQLRVGAPSSQQVAWESPIPVSLSICERQGLPPPPSDSQGNPATSTKCQLRPSERPLPPPFVRQ